MAALITNALPSTRDDGGPQTAAVCVHCGLPVPAGRRSTSPAGKYCCVGCRIAFHITTSGGAGPDVDSRTVSALMLRLGAGAFLAMNIMVFSGLFYGREVYDPHAPMDALSALVAYLLMALCAAVIALLGTPLAVDALDRLLARPDDAGGLSAWRGRVDANGLILIGVAAAFTLSSAHTFHGQGPLYFDTAAMVLVLVTLGRAVEATARRKALLEAHQLLRDLPAQAVIRDQQTVRELPVKQVRIGNVVQVKPGQAACVDGRVVEGSAHLREAILTGESRPRSVGPGDHVPAGAIALDGQLWLETTRTTGHRLIDQMVQMLEHARTCQPAIQRTADTVAALFVPGVVLLAFAVFTFHAFTGSVTQGLFTALAVLLISCPCALGLAAPLASWTALRRAASRGMLIDGPETLERLARLKLIAFDKTGTLTRDAMQLQAIELIDGAGGRTQTEILAIAAAIESASDHPIARALTAESANLAIFVPQATDACILPGAGVEATVNDRRCQLGNRRLLNAAATLHLPAAPGSQMELLLIIDSQVVARLWLREQVRDDAAAAVASVHALGMKTALLTGDEPTAAQHVAQTVGIDAAMTRAGCLPDQKLAALRAWRECFGPVGMVGDGLNDGPVLAGADVGFAVSGATDLSRQAGHIHLLADALDRVPQAIALGRHTVHRIRWNLAWAFGYNTIGLVLAAAGLLTPIFAASAMLVSSAVIIAMSRGAGARPLAATPTRTETPAS